MVAQGILGGQLYNGKYELYETHKTLGNIVTATYFTGAGLSLFSPPPLVNKKIKGWSSSKAHKALATVHLSAMIATNLLAKKIASFTEPPPILLLGALPWPWWYLNFSYEKNSITSIFGAPFVGAAQQASWLLMPAESTITYYAKHPLHRWSGENSKLKGIAKLQEGRHCPVS